jgi:hypothetical protein
MFFSLSTSLLILYIFSLTLNLFSFIIAMTNI